MMHQNAIMEGVVEPRGNGAAATVTKRRTDEIQFAGGRIAVVINQITLKFNEQATQRPPQRSFAPPALVFKGNIKKEHAQVANRLTNWVRERGAAASGHAFYGSQRIDIINSMTQKARRKE
jgi:hypothetical protein